MTNCTEIHAKCKTVKTNHTIRHTLNPDFFVLTYNTLDSM